MTLDKEEFLIIKNGTKEDIIQEFKDKNIVLSCWICKRKHGEEFFALNSKRNLDKQEVAFSGKYHKFLTKIITYERKVGKDTKILMPVCLQCRFLLEEINKSPKKLNEEKRDQKFLYG